MKNVSDPRPSESLAAKAATAILGQFRRSDSDDPEIYYHAFKTILLAYPESAVRRVAHPLRGIAGQQTFLPSPAELKAALDKIIEAEAVKARRERELARTREFLTECGVTPEERERAWARWQERRKEFAA